VRGRETIHHRLAAASKQEAWLPRRRGSTLPVPATEEVAMSESTQDRPDEANEQEKPGEPDTETEGGFPKEAPDSKDGEEQTKQDQ
jgi:hypothetical protein